MKELLNQFIKNLILYTAILALASLSVSFFLPGFITKYWPMVLLLIAGITLIIVTLLFSANEKKFIRFSNTFMLASMIKILVLLVVIVGYSFTNQSDAIRFSVTLLIFYILYLGLEIFWLLKLQRTSRK